MKFDYLREHVSKGKLKLEHCKSENQTVDELILTKGVQTKVFKKLGDLIGIETLTNMN